jgi:2-methylisocitrate lyase-like PEP mutase family enzyme
MLDQGRSICEAVSIPVIGDGDTGHGNAVNVQRTVPSSPVPASPAS